MGEDREAIGFVFELLSSSLVCSGSATTGFSTNVGHLDNGRVGVLWLEVCTTVLVLGVSTNCVVDLPFKRGNSGEVRLESD